MLDPLFNSAAMQQLLLQPWFWFVFTLITTIFASTKVTLQGAACRRHIRNSQDSLLYNVLFFSFVSLFLAMTLKMQIPNPEILLWGGIMAATSVLFQCLYSVALTEGPVSVTVLIINFSVLVPTIVSAIVFKEQIYIAQLIGVICLIISFPLSMKTGGVGEKKANRKWLILTIITLIANSAGMTVQKMFKLTKSYADAPDTASNTFLLFIFVFGALLGLLVYLVKGRLPGAEKRTFKLGKSVILFAFAMGFDLAIYQKFYMTANLQIPGSFFFPTFTGLQSVVMTVIGIILFKDRLNRRQLVGVTFGILALVLLNFPVGVSFTLG